MQPLEKTVSFDLLAGDLSSVVIDDQRTMRTILRQMLNQLGINDVQEFAEGGEAWEYLVGCGQEVPDFIICDLHMEGMDGLDFVNKIRRSKNEAIHQIPVLVLTGDPDRLIHQVANQVGAAKVLKKPVSAPQLSEEIAEMVNSSM